MSHTECLTKLLTLMFFLISRLPRGLEIWSWTFSRALSVKSSSHDFLVSTLLSKPNSNSNSIQLKLRLDTVLKKIKSAQIHSASNVVLYYPRVIGTFLFVFFSKIGSKGPSSWKRNLIFKMFQTTSCGYSKLVSQGAWYNAKEISLIRASSAEKTPKMFLNIDIFSSTDKWAISDHFFDVFSGRNAQIELNPFAVHKDSWDTSLENPHEVVWNILKINFFNDWPPLRDP